MDEIEGKLIMISDHYQMTSSRFMAELLANGMSISEGGSDIAQSG
jgi:hypothetical protein